MDRMLTEPGRSDNTTGAAATGLAWVVGLVGQVVVPAYLIWVAGWESWAASYDGVVGAGRSTAGTAALVSAAAWLVQAVLTGYRRRRGSAAPSGFVFRVLGGLVVVGCLGTVHAMAP
jgi:hypothetical protein